MGKFLEGGIWQGTMSSGVSCGSQAACYTALSSNSQTYWGY
jgi:hypothetical protein